MRQTYVALIQEKLAQHHLGWFGHIQRRNLEASVHSDVLNRPKNTKRDKSRSKLTWEEVIKRDLKEHSISKELDLDKSPERCRFMYQNHNLGVRDLV
jgi:hypothetical protein